MVFLTASFGWYDPICDVSQAKAIGYYSNGRVGFGLVPVIGFRKREL